MFDLAAEMSKLPEPVTTEKPPQWAFWRHELWLSAQIWPANSFYNWPEVRHTMLQDHWPELVEREKSEMLRVSGKLPAGPYDFNPSLERNNIRQLYHLWKWEQVTGKKIADLESIVEIGGGYGALCLMARRMGFRGKYIIFDLPEFSLLQQWYLAEAGLDDVEFVTELPNQRVELDLLVGVYSLSEMEIMLRNKILHTYLAKNYLLLYSGQWEDYDNVGYFQGTPGRKGGAENWHHEEALHHNDRNNWYSIGWTE